jgi:hypothetical protein
LGLGLSGCRVDQKWAKKRQDEDDWQSNALLHGYHVRSGDKKAICKDFLCQEICSPLFRVSQMGFVCVVKPLGIEHRIALSGDISRTTHFFLSFSQPEWRSRETQT